eukprot:jgi/Ulvmu1/8750/UM048_0004.1
MAVTPEKVGAGLLFCCEGDVLVLLRNSKHNNNTWGLPGGNADKEDNGDLLETARREAKEELEVLPEYAVRGQVLTKRGKRDQKHYTVFVCAVTRAVHDAYVPKLNPEHSKWRWFAAAELRARDDLHPVVHSVLHTHWPEVEPLLLP